MIASALGIANEALHSIGVPYECMRWTSPVEYPYFIGEYSEIVTDTEDGYEEYTLMITGTGKDSWLELEQHRANIKDHFSPAGGLRITTDQGVVVFFYENSFPVDTGEADLKRIQINIQIKAWKGLN